MIADRLHLEIPISLWCSTVNERLDNQSVRALKRPDNLPGNSFIELKELQIAPECRVLLASPELCFLQAAKYLDFNQLVFFGTELCGLYVYDNNAEYKQRSRLPITTAKKLAEFAEHAEYFHGHQKAVAASRYILDRSNSPMETMLSILSCYPLMRGGYSLIRPELNAKLQLTDEAKNLMQGRNCYGDFVWEWLKLVLEYDSDISHLSSFQHQIDKRRASALAMSGYTVITVTNKNVSSLYELDQLFCMLRKMLNMRPVHSQLDKYADRRRELIQTFRNCRSSNNDGYPKTI